MDEHFEKKQLITPNCMPLEFPRSIPIESVKGPVSSLAIKMPHFEQPVYHFRKFPERRYCVPVRDQLYHLAGPELFRIWVVPKIRGTFLGAPSIRTMVFGGLYWGPLILGNYHLGFRGMTFGYTWIVHDHTRGNIWGGEVAFGFRSFVPTSRAHEPQVWTC